MVLLHSLNHHTLRSCILRIIIYWNIIQEAAHLIQMTTGHLSIYPYGKIVPIVTFKRMSRYAFTCSGNNVPTCKLEWIPCQPTQANEEPIS